jgi:hypothetical protein
MKINAKTFAGVGLGLLAGYFLFKSKDKKIIYIGGMGLAGGILANLLLNQKTKNENFLFNRLNTSAFLFG